MNKRKIKILPKYLQDRIAAGEVIERPASVVKELLENSLDANATEISIDIIGAGKRLIKVTDNGFGMDMEDLKICFFPHATSKINSEEELYKIQTLGFRGEALSSIASVSKIRIISQAEHESIGGFVEVSEGKLIKQGHTIHKGTTVEVRDLFFNIPVRRKFLKSAKTEIYHIITTVTEIAVCNPNVSFILKIDNNETLNLPKAESRGERILQIFGIEFFKKLIEINKGSLHIFLSKEGCFHSNRANQYIFINARPIKDISIKNAIYKGYEKLLPSDKHPIFFLYLEIPPEKVDFNVHPTKREVRFLDKDFIYRMIYSTVKEMFLKKLVIHKNGNVLSQVHSEDSLFENYKEKNPIKQSEIEEISDKYKSEDRYKFLRIGDVFFAFSDEEQGITIVDQHAACERILYEKLKNMSVQTIQLLFPIQVTLPAKEFNTLVLYLELLNEIGIEVEVFGKRTLLVRSVPEFLDGVDLQEIFFELATSIINEERTTLDDIKDKIAKTIACHRSIRGKNMLDNMEMKKLINDLLLVENPYRCPHGRPTMIYFSIEELRKMFKR